MTKPSAFEQNGVRLLSERVSGLSGMRRSEDNIGRSQFHEAVRVVKQMNDAHIHEALVRLGMVGEREALMAKARELGCAFVDLDRIQISPEAILCVNGAMAVKHGVIPVKRQDNTLYLSMSNPNDVEAIDAVSVASQCRVVPVLSSHDAIREALIRYYPNAKG